MSFIEFQNFVSVNDRILSGRIMISVQLYFISELRFAIISSIFIHSVNIFEQNMGKFLGILLAIMLAIQSCDSYFLNFAGFSGELNSSSGTVIKRQGISQKAYYFNSNSTQIPIKRNLQQSLYRFQYYFGQRFNKNYVYDLPRPNNSWYNLRFRNIANNAPEMQGVKNMYSLLGLPKQVVQDFYVPYLKMLLNYIDYSFSLKVDWPNENGLWQQIYLNLKSMKKETDRVVNTYLKDVNYIIVGKNNRATGQKLFISTDNMEVNANNSFIYNGDVENKKVKGKNIMRTKRYEINFDEIQDVKVGQIGKCIKVLS